MNLNGHLGRPVIHLMHATCQLGANATNGHLGRRIRNLMHTTCQLGANAANGHLGRHIRNLMHTTYLPTWCHCNMAKQEQDWLGTNSHGQRLTTDKCKPTEMSRGGFAHVLLPRPSPPAQKTWTSGTSPGGIELSVICPYQVQAAKYSVHRTG